MRKRFIWMAGAIALLALVLLSCTLGDRAARITPTPTKTLRPLFTATYTPTATLLPTDTPLPPTATPVPPPAPTSRPEQR